MRVHADLACLADPTGLPGAAMLEASEATGHSRQLLLQLNAQRTKGFLCDVILVVQNALFRAHKNVLAASSAYLKALVVHDNLINLDQEMVSPAVFRAVLDFIYTGRLGPGAEGEAEPAGVTSAEPALGAILAAASYLQIPDLVALCKRKLKRSGKYYQLRGGGGGGSYSASAPFGKLARGLRAATPVIQSCFGAPPRPVEPSNPLSTHCGELYAAAAAAAAAHPHGLCPPLCGLDLSKKSPNGPSPQLPPPPESRLRAAVESREGVLQPRPESPALLPPHAAFGDPGSTAPLQAAFAHLHHRGSGGSSPGTEPSARVEVAPEFLYRWMKHEPLVAGYVEEEDDDEEEDEGDCGGARREQGGGGERELEPQAPSPSGTAPPPPRHYLESAEPDGEAEDLEPDKSTSEETGCSSGGPSPAGGSLERYLGYEPESFGGDNLYVCIPCGKGFPSSEQLNAHVEAHNEEDELYRKEAAAASAGPDGKLKLDFPEGVLAMARLAQQPPPDKELFQHTSHFLAAAAAAAAAAADPKAALESLYLGLSPDKTAEVLAQGAVVAATHHLHNDHHARTIGRFSPP